MQGVKNPDNDIDKLHFLQEKSPRLFVQTGFGNSANRLILITMNRPQLVLVPPPPSLPLDVPQSRRWPDGSELRVLEDGSIWRLEAVPYAVKRRATTLSLVIPTSSSDKP
jgi:hypothetical protein